MRKLSFLNFKVARQVISSGAGRKPNLHWKILFMIGVLFITGSLLVSGFVFWWGIEGQTEVFIENEQNHSFNKKHFESVIEYFKVRAERFEESKKIVVPVDPS